MCCRGRCDGRKLWHKVRSNLEMQRPTPTYSFTLAGCADLTMAHRNLHHKSQHTHCRKTCKCISKT